MFKGQCWGRYFHPWR